MGVETLWNILEVVFIGLTAAVTVGFFFRAKSVVLHERITKVEDKLVELSVECLRRHDIEPIRGDIADLRRRIDDLITLHSKSKNK